MTSQPETLTQLVVNALDSGLTYRALRDNAVDPETEYQPSIDTLHKISKGRGIRLTPELVRAIAAGLRIAPTRAQRAAALQYAGYQSEAVAGGGTAVRSGDADPSDMAVEEGLVGRWDREHADRHNPSSS